MEVEILSADEIDYSSLSFLLLSAFESDKSSTYQRNKQKYKLSVQELRRKYTTSVHPSYCAIIKNKGAYIASNGLLGIDINTINGVVKSWMSCDTSVSPNYRGNGYSKKCLIEIINLLEINTIFFGFPNASSVPIFKKLGWTERNKYKLIYSPTKPVFSANTFRIQQFDKFTINNNDTFGINKSLDYLNWRYPSSDSGYQKYFGEKDNDTFELVISVIEVKSIKIVAILELFTNSRIAYKSGMRTANKISLQNGCVGVIFANNELNEKYKNFASFPVSAKIVKRDISLMGMFIGQDSKDIWSTGWREELGDWDSL